MLVSYTILDNMFEYRIFYDFLLYILIFLCWFRFLSKKLFWTAGTWNIEFWRLEKWYLCFWVCFEGVCRDKLQFLNMFFTKHYLANFLEKQFLMIENPNGVRKSQNLSRCRVITCRDYGKNLRKFRANCDVRWPKPRHIRI